TCRLPQSYSAGGGTHPDGRSRHLHLLLDQLIADAPRAIFAFSSSRPGDTRLLVGWSPLRTPDLSREPVHAWRAAAGRLVIPKQLRTDERQCQLGELVGVSEYGESGLLHGPGPRERLGLLRHVHVEDAALGDGEALRPLAQGGHGRGEPAHARGDLRLHRVDLGDV